MPSPFHSSSFLSWVLENIPLPFSTSRPPHLAWHRFSHGQSNLTYLIAVQPSSSTLIASDRTPGELFRFVVRMPPPKRVDDLKRTAHRIDWEFELLRSLYKEGSVPVPKVYAYCDDPRLIGSEFFAMEFVNGRVFKKPGLGSLPPGQRRLAYKDFARVLARLHKITIEDLGVERLNSRLKKRDGLPYLERQLWLWMRRVRGAEALKLGEELERELLALRSKPREPCLVHGDWRIDNVVFHATEPRIIAVLDWELASVGNPLGDLGSACLPYWAGLDVKSRAVGAVHSIDGIEGIPGERHFVSLYNQAGGNFVSPNEMRVLIAFSMFRTAGILFGVDARRKTGVSDLAHYLAKRGRVVLRQHARDGRESLRVASMFSKWKGNPDDLDHLFTNTGARERPRDVLTEPDKKRKPQDATASFSKKVHVLEDFMKEHVLPLEDSYAEHCTSDKRWEVWPRMERLKSMAKQAGLWNLWLPRDLGGVYTNLQYASFAEIMGRCVFASEIFNCSPPDTGNMEILSRFGTSNQKEKWLEPLLEGKIRSCFAMTEPAVASSDATNLSLKIDKLPDGTYKLSGRKWWSSGGMDPRCKLIVLVGKGPTSSTGTKSTSKHNQHTILLIPMNQVGVRVRRHLKLFGFDDAPHGHAEIEFNDVVVKAEEALLCGEGRGFEVAQSRLGAGRIHHCMRLIGMAERGFEMMLQRASSRSAFGMNIIDFGDVRSGIAQSRCEIEQGRLLTCAAATAVDSGNIKKARGMIAMAKIVVPTMACKVLDRAIQIHGGMGVCQDTVLSHMWVLARSLRLADGPDAAHIAALAKTEIARFNKTGLVSPRANL